MSVPPSHETLSSASASVFNSARQQQEVAWAGTVADARAQYSNREQLLETNIKSQMIKAIRHFKVIFTIVDEFRVLSPELLRIIVEYAIGGGELTPTKKRIKPNYHCSKES
jgi:hypothetical protein